jgi:hypothetical protein
LRHPLAVVFILIKKRNAFVHNVFSWRYSFESQVLPAHDVIESMNITHALLGKDEN